MGYFHTELWQDIATLGILAIVMLLGFYWLIEHLIIKPAQQKAMEKARQEARLIAQQDEKRVKMWTVTKPILYGQSKLGVLTDAHDQQIWVYIGLDHKYRSVFAAFTQGMSFKLIYHNHPLLNDEAHDYERLTRPEDLAWYHLKPIPVNMTKTQ